MAARILPQLEALFAIAACEPNGYVLARSRKKVAADRIIWYSHMECYYHFSCRMLHYWSSTYDTLAFHRGVDNREVIGAAVARAFADNKLQVMATMPYDGRYASECYQCNRKRLTVGVETVYGKLFVNGPTTEQANGTAS